MKGWNDDVGIKDVGEMKAGKCGEEKLPSLCFTAVRGRINYMKNEEQVQNQGIQDSKAGERGKASAWCPSSSKPSALISLVENGCEPLADDIKQLLVVTE